MHTALGSSRPFTASILDALKRSRLDLHRHYSDRTVVAADLFGTVLVLRALNGDRAALKLIAARLDLDAATEARLADLPAADEMPVDAPSLLYLAHNLAEARPRRRVRKS